MKSIHLSFAVVTSATCLGAIAAQPTVYGTVVSSTPVTVQVAVPRQQCSDAPGYVQAPPTGGGAILGGVLGGLAGNAIGAGAGRALATGVGAIAGIVAGNSIEAATAPAVPVTTTNCVYSRAVEARLIGYDVVYEFNGERYTTRTQRDPGQRIALDLRPSGSAPTGVPLSPYDAPSIVDAQPSPTPYPNPYPVTTVPVPVAYPAYADDPPYPSPYPPYGYGGYYGYPGIVIQGGFGGGWHGGGHRGR